MKEYIKPEVDFVNLLVEEEINSGNDLGDGEMGLESSIF